VHSFAPFMYLRHRDAIVDTPEVAGRRETRRQSGLGRPKRRDARGRGAQPAAFPGGSFRARLGATRGGSSGCFG
jgi:hypothetical protein